MATTVPGRCVVPFDDSSGSMPSGDGPCGPGDSPSGVSAGRLAPGAGEGRGRPGEDGGGGGTPRNVALSRTSGSRGRVRKGWTTLP